jgi:hypothetical protein
LKKFHWKIEYSITTVFIFAIVLLLIPTKFIESKEASYISIWNEIYHKMEYVFNAMNAHADSNIAKGFKNAKERSSREKLMMNMVKPYLRISVQNELNKKYIPTYMNNEKVNENDEFFFDNLYLTSNNRIVGIKDVKDNDIYHPAFRMMFDVNGLKGPNMWGKDIFGLNIFVDGRITPLGAGKSIDDLKKDCSEFGTGVFCSYYYRIGGDFKE